MLSNYGQELFERIDPTLYNCNEIYGSGYSMGFPDYTEVTMKEENGQIIVTTSTPYPSVEGEEPQDSIQENIYNTIEFKDIYGNSISYHQCVSVEYLS